MNKTQYVIYLYRELSSRHRGRISVASSIALVFLFLTWGLNFTVCFCVIKNRKLHKLTNFFLVILAFADLTWEVTVMPLWIDVLINAYNELKEHKRETRGKVRIQIFAVPEMIKEEVEQTTSKDEIQATRTLLGIVYVYCLCSILTTSIEMADAYRPYFLDRGTHLALTFFGFVNSILNPLMLTRTNKEFRDVVVVMVGCKWNSRAIHVQ
ncbi:hypothetical protein AC249_AIPGENE29026 [Exaiptasia diaphana]|nr:hypothetical protein AC249_AIPGENE29026 [Exaiptasia diaphana]